MPELRAWLRLGWEGWWAELVWTLVRIGYTVRPYDMLADRRRWWWQPRTRCGWQMGIQAREADDA